jgi:hypothetical protein
MSFIKLTTIMLLMSLSLNAFALTCAGEGKSIAIYPGAPECCPGLELQPPPPGMLGTAGKCVKKKKCAGEGKSIAIYPGAPKCCSGLELQPPPPGMLGTAGKCVMKKECAGEGKSIAIYPGAPKCCSGLELQPPPPGMLGTSGTCVAHRFPPAPEVNDSRLQLKELGPRKQSVKPTSSVKSKQE